MKEDRLRELLRDVPVPEAAEAERRGARVVAAAFEQRRPSGGPSRHRLAIALAAATLVMGLLLSSAGAAVRDWIDDVFTGGVPNADPALTAVPGGGRLLVQGEQGPWVVQADGSRRLLGRYDEAAWSPRGLFVVAAAGRTLTAVEPDGTPRWSLSAAGAVSDPRWSPSGIRIAYRAGPALRVVAGDGTGDDLLAARTGPVPPAWSPVGPHLLAYVDASRRLRVVNADTGQTIGSGGVAADARELAWSPDGSQLLEVGRRSLLLSDVTVDKLGDELRLEDRRRLPLPVGTVVGSASFSPRDENIAAVVRRPEPREGPLGSEVVLIGPEDGSTRQLFIVPGRLSDLAWSPHGERLLIPWADADQWLFIPVDGRPVRAIGGISTEFSPGADPGPTGFPRIDGWCCATAAR